MWNYFDSQSNWANALLHVFEAVLEGMASITASNSVGNIRFEAKREGMASNLASNLVSKR